MKILILSLVALLSACTTSPASKSEARIVPLLADKPSGCTVKLLQDGVEIIPVVVEGVRTFKLSPKRFRIEVTPTECSPTIALVTSHQLEYILQAPLAFSPSGVFMAGDSTEADILSSIGGDNPRTSLSEVISSTNQPAWAKQQFEELCASLGYCPTPTLAFSTAWPFLDPVTTEFRGYAEINRFSKFESMSAASGKALFAVIYTRWKTLTKGTNFNQSVFYVLQPNALVLDFR